MSKKNHKEKVNKSKGNSGNSQGPDSVSARDGSHYTKKGKLKSDFYEPELLRLQEEMVKIQYWVKEKNLRVVIVF